jgi:hypothetical protein
MPTNENNSNLKELLIDLLEISILDRLFFRKKFQRRILDLLPKTTDEKWAEKKPKSKANSSIIQWETPLNYWSNVKLPGYKYSYRKKAFWKKKN